MPTFRPPAVHSMVFLAASTLAASVHAPARVAFAQDGCVDLAWREGCALSIGFDAELSVVGSVDHDGDGVPSLFAAGAGGASGAAFEGLVQLVDGRWVPFGARFFGKAAKILAADLDGDGAPSLVVLGGLQSEPDGTKFTMLEWDGSSWIGRAPGYGITDAVVLDDDGDGVATLFASAWFPDVSVPSWVVRWTASGWASVSSAGMITPAGFNPSSIPLAAFDSDGDGREELFATVHVSVAGVTIASGMARWNGSAWLPAAGIVPPVILTSGTVRSMCVVDADGDGERELIAGGDLSNVPIGSAPQVAAFDGTSWSGVGDAFIRETPSLGDGRIRLVAAAPLGPDGGAVLLAAGWFSRVGGTPAAGIARWHRGAWTAVGGGFPDSNVGPTKGLFGEDVDGDGDVELVGFGSFVSVGTSIVNRAAAFDGDAWGPLGVAASSIGLNGSTRDSALFDHDGDGRVSLVVAGSRVLTDQTGGRDFTTAGGNPAPGLAVFDGFGWQALPNPWPNGVEAWPNGVEALLVADLDGDGADSLYAAGDTGEPFQGSVTVRSIAVFRPSKSGGTWTPVPGRFGGYIGTLAAIDHDLDGQPSLFAGGSFTRVDGVTVGRLARLDGAVWQGFDPGAGGERINDITAFDHDGDGQPSMIAAIGSSSPSTSFQRIRRWSAGQWSDLGAMAQGHVFALQAFDDDGDGASSLFAFGDLYAPTGDTLAQRWDAGSWTQFGPIANVLDSRAGAGLVAFDDDGDGQDSVFLHATDPFSASRGALFRKTDAGWLEAASGLAGGASRARVADLDGDGRVSLYLDGVLRARPGSVGSGIGIIDACVAACPADIDLDGAVGVSDLAALLGAWGACGGGACPADLDASGAVDARDIGVLLDAWGACR